MTQSALIIIDIQNDYFPGGKLELNQPEIAAANTTELVSAFRTKSQPIYFIQHDNLNPALDFMTPNSEGQKLHPSMNPGAGESVVVKNFPNSFWQTDLEEQLNKAGVNHVVITGMMSHMCVSTTARAAMERGFAVTVVADACATLALNFKDEVIPAETVHITAIAELGLIAEIVDTQDILKLR